MLTGFYPSVGAARTNLVLQLSNSNTNNSTNNTYKALAASPAPTTSGDAMVFNGTTQLIKFSDKPEFHVTAPYSVEVEFNTTTVAGNRWIATCGEGFNSGWPEWSIALTGNTLTLTSSKNNTGDDLTLTYSSAISINRWYRVGFMFYLDSNSNLRLRGYLNGAQVFDVSTFQPYDTSLGIAIGGDYSGVATRLFTGKLRNFYFGQSLFWTV